MAALGRIRKFYDDNLSIGDRLGEAIYAVWMVVASVGLINAEAEITRGTILTVIVTALVVNFVWGIIDGVTVMLTNTIDRSKVEALVFDLRSRPHDPAARALVLADLEDSAVGALSAVEKERVIDMIAAGAPGPDVRHRRLSPRREDWLYALAIVAIDVGLAIPVLLPLLIFKDVHTAIFVSRIVATYIFAALGAIYARNLRRRPWIAALLLGAFGHSLFGAFYAAGW